MSRTAFAVLLTFAALAATPALAGDGCNVPETRWQPREALQHKLEGQGWKVFRIKTEDGCYEAYAHDETGRRVEAYFDSQALEAVKIKHAD